MACDLDKRLSLKCQKVNFFNFTFNHCFSFSMVLIGELSTHTQKAVVVVQKQTLSFNRFQKHNLHITKFIHFKCKFNHILTYLLSFLANTTIYFLNISIFVPLSQTRQPLICFLSLPWRLPRNRLMSALSIDTSFILLVSVYTCNSDQYLIPFLASFAFSLHLFFPPILLSPFFLNGTFIHTTILVLLYIVLQGG